VHLVSACTMKYFQDVAIGELCQVRLGGNGNGWVVPLQRDGAKTLVAILKIGDEVRPMIHEMNGFRGECLSFGSDWQIETDLSEVETKKGLHRETAGSIHLHSTGTTMYLSPFMTEVLDEGYPIDLPSLEHGKVPHDAIAVLRWKLWANEASRLKPGASPLIEFSGH